MLADSIHKAYDSAARMVSVARLNLKAADLPSILTGGNYGGSTSDPTERLQLANAAQQYQHNRGWVYACVKLVAQRIAGQTIHVARDRTSPAGAAAGGLATKSVGETKALHDSLPLCFKGMADQLEPLDDHPLLSLLRDPNDLMVGWSLIFSTIASLELTGRSLWFITEEESGEPAIMPIPTHWLYDVDKKRATWKIRPAGSSQTIEIPGERIFHCHYPDPADPWGVQSPLSAIAAAVTTDEQISEAHFRTFRNGIMPTVAVTVGKLPASPSGGEAMRPNLTPEQRKQIIEAIRRSHMGVHKLGEPIILDGMVESVTRLALTPDELGFLDSSNLTKQKILQCFAVGEILLGGTQNANRAASLAAEDIVNSGKINPLIENISQCMTAWLGPMFARPGERLTIWIEKAVARDPDSDFKWWQLLASKGAATVNELRRYRNLPDVPDGDSLIAAGPSGPGAGSAETATADDLFKTLNPYTLRRLTLTAPPVASSNGHAS